MTDEYNSFIVNNHHKCKHITRHEFKHVLPCRFQACLFVYKSVGLYKTVMGCEYLILTSLVFLCEHRVPARLHNSFLADCILNDTKTKWGYTETPWSEKKILRKKNGQKRYKRKRHLSCYRNSYLISCMLLSWGKRSNNFFRPLFSQALLEILTTVGGGGV